MSHTSWYEVILNGVGPLLAKEVLKIWAKESIAPSIKSFIESKIKDPIVRSRGTIQLHQVGSRMAEQLVSALERDENSEEEISRLSIALALESALAGYQASAQDLLALDLDSSRVESQIRAACPAAEHGLTSREKEVFGRVLTICCELTINTASSLPGFSERTFAELLKRDGEIISLVRDTLDEIRRIHEDTRQSSPTRNAKKFESDYLRGVVRELDEVELFGIDLKPGSNKHRLSVAYISLSVEQRAVVRHPDRDAPEIEERPVVNVENALVDSAKLVLRGGAGSGKTTLLQWIAVRAASASFPSVLSGCNGMVPFFIRLRAFAGGLLPSPEQFPALLVPSVAATMPDGWVHARLDEGRALILVDGLDEISANRRSEVRKWLRGLIEQFPKARFVVSTRPHAVTNAWLKTEGFDEAELQPMELADIISFANHWHNAIRDQLDDRIERESLDALERNFVQTVRDVRAVRALASSPLLCAMLCALHQNRRKEIPSDRIQLYRICCEALIDRRDRERGIKLGDYPDLSYPQKLGLLQDLAYWMMKNGLTGASQEQVEERLNYKLKNYQRIDPSVVTGASVRRLFVERTGVVREPSVKRIDFVHRTFQEFLAAQAILDESDMGLAIGHAANEQWHETIVLLAGLATGVKASAELMNGLLRRGDIESGKVQKRIHLLAVACMETVLELTPEIKQDVQHRFRSLVPPHNLTDARSLAAAGNLVVPYLQYSALKANVAVACVRTLSLIGTDPALDQLEQYASDSRISVCHALCRALEYFDEQSYSSRILSKCQHLRLRDFSSLEWMRGMRTCLSIDLSNSTISSVAPLSTIHDKSKIHSISLSHMPELRSLAPLDNMDGALYVTLTNLPKTVDLSTVAFMRSLRNLAIDAVPGEIDLNEFRTKHLSALRIAAHAKSPCILRNFASIARFTHLGALLLYGHNAPDSLTPISNLEFLYNLNISVSMIDSLVALENLHRLNFLDLRDGANIDSLESLSKTTGLKFLSLRGFSRVDDLSPLAAHKNMMSITLHKMEGVRDLSPLADLPNLQYVYVDRPIQEYIVPANFANRVHVFHGGVRSVIPPEPLLRLETEI